MQGKILKAKIFQVIHKSVKSMKVFSLEIFKLYGIRYYQHRFWLTAIGQSNCGPPVPCTLT